MKTQKKDLTTVAYEQGVQYHLKKVAESGSDVHENYTPAEICDMMLDKVDLTKAETVLVLYNIELLFALKKRKFSGHVTFFTQSEEKTGLAPKIFSNLTVEYIDKEENPLYHMETKWPEKFDIVIANPPYSGKLDLKFLDKAFDIAKKDIIFVHPSSFLVDRKKVTGIYNQIRNKIKKNISSIEFFNGNGIFGIGLYVPCSITHIDKSIENENFFFKDMILGKELILQSENIEDLSVFGYNKNFSSLENKIKSIIEKEYRSLDDFCLYGRNPEKNFYVEFTHVKGHTIQGEKVKTNSKLHLNDFFVTISKNLCQVKEGGEPKYKMVFEFASEAEANNFISFLKTYFLRMCLALSKTNQHLDTRELKMIPWMDFTQEWTDEKLYAHFDITGEEQAFIKEVIPPYYD